jgi:alkanesulfonate monooxygenase SsuD/methylene tetrahydromethanopterin reductase-like flavin-dependent oxidoreductase (luciferase family)
MKVDGGVGLNLSTVGAQAAELEEMGYTGVMTAETAHDPFFPLLVAAQNTEKVQLMTSIAVAFARSPMTLANIGHDLNAYSKGRFVLGPWVSNQTAHHQAVFHAMDESCGAHARIYYGDAVNLGLLA